MASPSKQIFSTVRVAFELNDLWDSQPREFIDTLNLSQSFLLETCYAHCDIVLRPKVYPNFLDVPHSVLQQCKEKLRAPLMHTGTPSAYSLTKNLVVLSQIIWMPIADTAQTDVLFFHNYIIILDFGNCLLCIFPGVFFNY